MITALPRISALWPHVLGGDGPDPGTAADLIAAIMSMLSSCPDLPELTAVYWDEAEEDAVSPYLVFTVEEEQPGETMDDQPNQLDLDLYSTDRDQAQTLGAILANWVDPWKSGRERMVFTEGRETSCLRGNSTCGRVSGLDRRALRWYGYTVRFEVHVDKENV